MRRSHFHTYLITIVQAAALCSSPAGAEISSFRMALLFGTAGQLAASRSPQEPNYAHSEFLPLRGGQKNLCRSIESLRPNECQDLFVTSRCLSFLRNEGFARACIPRTACGETPVDLTLPNYDRPLLPSVSRIYGFSVFPWDRMLKVGTEETFPQQRDIEQRRRGSEKASQ